MASLIYIARITRSSEELAQGLQSAGLHVKSFASGEITADECLLVMTSEAVLALQPANAAPRAGQKPPELECVSVPPNMNANLAAQAEIWNRLKTAAAKESATDGEQPSSVASKVESETRTLGSTPGEVGLHRLATLQKSAETLEALPVAPAGSSAKTGNPTYSPLSLPIEDKSQLSSAQVSAVSRGNAWRPGGRSRTVNGPRFSQLWQTVAIAASMLLFAAIRPAMTDVTAGGANPSTRFVADSKESTQTASGRRSGATSQISKSPLPRSSHRTPKAEGVQRHQSNYDLAAEGFTNHFDLAAHNISVLRNSELKDNNPQSSVKPKRIIVVN